MIRRKIEIKLEILQPTGLTDEVVKDLETYGLKNNGIVDYFMLNHNNLQITHLYDEYYILTYEIDIFRDDLTEENILLLVEKLINKTNIISDWSNELLFKNLEFVD